MTNWFQTEECYDFYKSLSFLEPFKFEVKRGDDVKGRIVGYIQKDGGRLKQFFSRRAIINGGPMLAEDITESEVETLLTECKDKLKGKAIYIEIRNFDDYSTYWAIFEKCGWRYEPHYNFILGTTSDDVLSRFSENHRRSIKSAIKQGARINNTPESSQIMDFYTILANLYSTKVKTPLFPEEFFQKLAAVCKIITVHDCDNKVIGGIAIATKTGETVYEWFVCGDDLNYKKLHPSTLATYAGIKYAQDFGYKKFDFMGAGAPGDRGYGVRDFKAKFGGQLVEYGRFKCVLNPLLYKVGVVGIKFMKRIR